MTIKFPLFPNCLFLKGFYKFFDTISLLIECFISRVLTNGIEFINFFSYFWPWTHFWPNFFFKDLKSNIKITSIFVLFWVFDHFLKHIFCVLFYSKVKTLCLILLTLLETLFFYLELFQIFLTKSLYPCYFLLERFSFSKS